MITCADADADTEYYTQRRADEHNLTVCELEPGGECQRERQRGGVQQSDRHLQRVRLQQSVDSAQRVRF